MNEKQKLYVILSTIIILVVTMVVIGVTEQQQGEKILNKVKNALNNETGELIYIKRTGCSWCDLYQDELSYMKSNYELEYYEVDIKKLTEKQLSELLYILEIDGSTFGTPHMTYVKDGKVIEQLSSYNTADDLFAFSQKHEQISLEASLPVNYISFDEYKETIKSKTPEVIVLGQTGCGYCVAARPVLDSVVEDYDVKINYFNISKFTLQEEKDEFTASLKYLEENQIGTPLMLIVKNGEVIASLENLNTKEKYVEFLRTNKIITE